MKYPESNGRNPALVFKYMPSYVGSVWGSLLVPYPHFRLKYRPSAKGFESALEILSHWAFGEGSVRRLN